MSVQPYYLTDDREAERSPYTRGNRKIGEQVFAYSRTPIDTCPGHTVTCALYCYAVRIYEQGPEELRHLYEANAGSTYVPPIPEEARLLRIHVSGDFDTVPYTRAWAAALDARPDVRAWFYTRSWRVPLLRRALTDLAMLPNVQAFASIDPETEAEWRAFSAGWNKGPDGSPGPWREARVVPVVGYDYESGKDTLLCPQESKDPSTTCARCGYCYLQPMLSPVSSARRHLHFVQH